MLDKQETDKLLVHYLKPLLDMDWEDHLLLCLVELVEVFTLKLLM